MSTEETKSRIRTLFQRAALAVEATGLNASVMLLQTRLWWAKKRVLWMLGSIDDARDRMRAACQREADRALKSVTRSTPIRSIGLSRVILSSLEKVRINALSDLDPNIYQLEKIPNIGPARAKSIILAFHEAMRKSALVACRTTAIDEQVQHYVLYRSSVAGLVADLCSKQAVLSKQAEDYYADAELYGECPEYRAVTMISRQSLREDAERFFDEVRISRKKLAKGEWVLPPDIMSDNILRSQTSKERGQIVLRFNFRYLRQIEIRDGAVVD
jgi:hypothetical protein